MSEAQAFGGRLTAGERPAILVVDLVNGFTDPTSPLGSDLDEVVEATARLLDVARSRNRPVLFTTISYRDDLADLGVWGRKVPALEVLTASSPWVEVDHRLEPRAGELVIAKRGASAWFGTDLAAALAERRVDSVVLCGATTSGCVRATAVDLVQGGYPTFVARDAVGDRDAAAHAGSLRDLELKYADVVEADEAIAILGGPRESARSSS